MSVDAGGMATTVGAAPWWCGLDGVQEQSWFAFRYSKLSEMRASPVNLKQDQDWWIRECVGQILSFDSDL